MEDPAYRAAAVACLRGAEAVRSERAKAAMQTPEVRQATSDRMRKSWQDPEFRLKATAASSAAQDHSWKAKHAAGIARLNQDKGWQERRLAAWRSPEAQARQRAGMAKPEVIAIKREKAIAQRAAQEAARQRVLAVIAGLGISVDLPDYRAGLSAWVEAEQRLLVGRAS
jgi:hypothetical protein